VLFVAAERGRRVGKPPSSIKHSKVKRQIVKQTGRKWKDLSCVDRRAWKRAAESKG